MLNCGAIFARTGTLNTGCTVGLASSGTNIHRQISTIARSKFLRSHLLELPQLCAPATQSRANTVRALTSHVLTKAISSSCARALCLRKIRTHLLAQNLSCTSASRNNTDIRNISKGEFTEDETQNRRHREDVFDDTSEEPHHRLHAPKHELKAADIERLYPDPRSKLNDIYMSVRSQLKQEDMLKIDYHSVSTPKHQWCCTLTVTWPEKVAITATASTKPLAFKVAATKCLQWLHNQGKLKKGKPLVYESKVVRDMMNKPTRVVVSEENLDRVRELIDEYNTEIKELLRDSRGRPNDREILISPELMDPVGRSRMPQTPESISYRNDTLRNRLNSRPPSGSRDLPIKEYQEQIIREIENNRALLIKGDTGCGKTTQVPQYIMDSFAARGRGSECNMIISQPRRISAISLAERIAEERAEQLGDVVGYQVRMQQVVPRTPGAMLFCTTGVVLRKLQNNPGLQGCSHVILDEAHERSIDTDMLMVLLKRAQEKNPELKVVVMSATINADLFQSYFDCGVVEVPGRTFPVEMNFLEDVEKLGIARRKEYVGGSLVPETPFVDAEQIAELVGWIARKKPPGAILCFLPGWAEITRVKRLLDQKWGRDPSVLIVPVHSRMSNQDQRRIFQRPPPGVRKIVLATDIAETGITVADVVYVVDSATRKGFRLKEKEGIMSIDTHYASQANLLQRKGRAGRVQPGTSYHLVTRAQFENLSIHPLPEVLTTSLEKTVLDCKTYSDEKAESFLGSMPQPPTKAAVRKAIADLENLGALDRDENLTPLGRRIALFSTHPKLSKAMVYSSIFQCVAPMITIASTMTADTEIFSGTLYDKEAIRRVKQEYHPTSDHISIVWIFEEFASVNQTGYDRAKQFCWNKRLVPDRMYTLLRVRDINAEHLVNCHMLQSVEEYDNRDGACNQYGGLDELVRGVLLSGLDQILEQRDFELRKGRLIKGNNVFIMEDGTRATVTQECVNFKRKIFPSPFMTYVRRQHSEERRTSLIRETSMISPVTALLFSQSRVHGFAMNQDDTKSDILLTITGRKNFKLSCEPRVADTLLQFRDLMWSVVRYYVENYGYVENMSDSDYAKVDEYKRRMMQVLATLLSDASETIDNPENVKKQPSLRDSDEFLD